MEIETSTDIAVMVLDCGRKPEYLGCEYSANIDVSFVLLLEKKGNKAKQNAEMHQSFLYR